ncbi:MAG: ferritin-like domain-containing protein [Desulfobacterota bacterium]|nr:ferritin-like domain-containing protein [Thermodesulfobacteriota bacterium]
MIHFKTPQEREHILQALQLNMNEEIRATLQYICHRIAAKRIDEVIADSFKSAGLDEMAHILYFSDLIIKCGETPYFEQWHIDTSTDLKLMLEADIMLEQAARRRYRQQQEMMAEYPELVAVLTSVLNDEQDHEETFIAYRSRFQ